MSGSRSPLRSRILGTRVQAGLCALALAVTMTAQVAPVPAADPVLTAFSLRAATVQSLTLPTDLGHAFTVALVLGGKPFTLQLAPHKVRACNFQLLVDDGTKLTPIVPPPENTFQGAVVGEPDSLVAASLWQGQLRAQVHLHGATWTVQPVSDGIAFAANADHVVFHQQDIVGRDQKCGVQARGPGGGIPGGPSLVLSGCEIAIDCDLQYFQNYGSNTTTTQNAVAALINAMDAVYRRDVGICYLLTTTIIRTTAVYVTGPETGCNASGLLQEMTTRWNTNHTNVLRDTAHLFTGQGTGVGTVGCANLGVICSTSSAYGVSRAVDANFAVDVALVSHEIGHNWNANHCDSAPPCYIMCSSLFGCTSSELKFGAGEQAAISTFRNSRTCLSPCGGCNNAASYTYFGNGCAGSATGGGTGCVQQNFGTNLAGFSYLGTDFFAVEANTGSAAREITGLDFYCSAIPATAVTVYVWAKAATGEPGAILATRTMNVGTTRAAYGVTFSPALVLGANTGFYVGFQNSPNLTTPAMTTGTAVPFYFGTGATGSWFRLNPPTDFWNFRVNCRGARATPLLFQSSLPSLNGTLTVELAQAPANAASALIYASTPAAVDLTPIGGTGCFVYFANQFLSQPATTNASGRASYSLTLPNLQALCGYAFYQQIAVIDAAANSLTVTTTRRGEPVVGN